MATQIEYEVYASLHKQKLMQTAQTNRDLNMPRKTSRSKKTGIRSIITWIRSFAIGNEFGYQNQSTRKTGNEKKLISS